jgi:hypothetical protein
MGNHGEIKGLLDPGLRIFDGPTAHTRIKNNKNLWDFLFYGMLYGAHWSLITEVPGQLIGPCNGQAVQYT